jgi:hypothetical protein
MADAKPDGGANCGSEQRANEEPNGRAVRCANSEAVHGIAHAAHTGTHNLNAHSRTNLHADESAVNDADNDAVDEADPLADSNTHSHTDLCAHAGSVNDSNDASIGNSHPRADPLADVCADSAPDQRPNAGAIAPPLLAHAGSDPDLAAHSF